MRQIGVSRICLIKMIDGKIVATAEFVDDYRPSLQIDRRYVKLDEMSGLIWYSDMKYFKEKEDGNEYFMKLKNDGYFPGTKNQVDKFTRKCAIMSY